MAENATSVAQLQKKPSRVVYAYTIPKRIAKEAGVQSIGLIELTAREEMLAAKRSNGEQFNLAHSLVTSSLHMVNDVEVSIGDGSADRAWETMNPKVRNLVLQAFADIHAPEDEDTADFLASRQVKA